MRCCSALRRTAFECPARSRRGPGRPCPFRSLRTKLPLRPEQPELPPSFLRPLPELAMATGPGIPEPEVMIPRKRPVRTLKERPKWDGYLEVYAFVGSCSQESDGAGRKVRGERRSSYRRFGSSGSLVGIEGRAVHQV